MYTYVGVDLQDSSDTVLALNASFNAITQQEPAALVASRNVTDVVTIDVSVGTFVSDGDVRVGGPSSPASQTLLGGRSGTLLALNAFSAADGQVSAGTARNSCQDLLARDSFIL